MEPTAPIVRAYRGGAGVLALGAVVATFGAAASATDFSAADFASYFTIESNVLIGALLLFLACRPDRAGATDVTRGACTLYIVITGLVYNALLRGQNIDVPNPILNEVLHVALPLIGLLDWVLVPTVRPIGRGRAVLFLLFPLAYFAYSLLRGRVVDWYPYPFLDPTVDGGYARVAIYAIVLLTVMLLLALGVAELGRMAHRGSDDDLLPDGPDPL